MAKTRFARPQDDSGSVTSATATASNPAELSAKTKKAIDQIKGAFKQFVTAFAALGEKRADLSPKFMKAFGLWQAETAGTFVDFVRFLVPEIGTKREEYRQHRAYQAADYLRRLAQQANRGEQRRRTPEERATAPVTAMDAMARLLASFIPIIPEQEQAKIWESLHEVLHWSDRQVLRMQTLIDEAQPLVVAKIGRGNAQEIPNLRLAVGVVTTAEEDEPRTGTNG